MPYELPFIFINQPHILHFYYSFHFGAAVIFLYRFFGT